MKSPFTFIVGYVGAIMLFIAGIVVDSIDLSLKFGMVAILVMIWAEITQLTAETK